MQTRRRTIFLGLSLVGAASSTAQTPADPQGQSERVYWDTLDDSGRLTGGVIELARPDRSALESALPAPWETLTASLGPVDPAHRIDLVIVGDGYTAAQLGTYATHANSIATQFFQKQPYTKYAPYFTVHRVDVVSVDSGVDHDPTQGILKNTAMHMGYWCSGIERLLCVNVGSAYQYANNAPDVDLVLAIANSTKYGGAGYSSSDLATSAGNNSAAVEIVRHEFGHALGNLADEYDYNDGATYTGGEPAAINTSKLTSSQMAAQQIKWWRWLGFNDPAWDGSISTYQGAGYYQFGLYRPTNNSIMRNLNRPFNLPSGEALVIEIYKLVDPIDASSSTTATYAGTETLFVTPMQPVGHSLTIQWSLDGAPIAGATGTTLDLSSLGLGGCPATISVTVQDPNPLVRDEAARAQWMTQTLDFQVAPTTPPIQNYCSTAPNSVGAGATMSWTGSSSISANDLTLLAIDCPPNTFGLFYYGQNETQTPFGNGFRCISAQVFRLPLITTTRFGDGVFDLNLAALPPGGSIAAGETKRFQFWYRNPAGGGAGFNLSDGLRVLFCP